jgi:hypothetical protein
MLRTWPFRREGRRRSLLDVLVVLGALAGPALGAGPAQAEPFPPATAESWLGAEIDVGTSGLEAEPLRAAIARELGVEVRLASGSGEHKSLSIRLGDGRRATVRFQPAGGRALERTLELPPDPDAAYETLALLSGNLARDEAAELLDQLRRKAAPSTTAAEGAPTDQDSVPQPTSVTVPKRPEPTNEPPPKAKPAARERSDKPRLESAPLNLSVFSPLALYPDSYQRRIRVELGLVYSHVGAIDGAGLSLGHLHVRHELEGAIVTLFLNRVDGPAAGALVSVGGNSAGDRLRGADVAVGFNHRSGAIKGAQIALGFNHAHAVEGAQLALGFNDNRGIEGAQLAIVNSAGDGTGVESGLVNVAGDLSGVQLGLLNVGTRVRGVQIGLVNVADRVDGASLGIVNVVGNARTRLVGWVDSSSRGNVGIKYQHAFIFTLISGGYRLNRVTEPQGEMLEPAFAIGGHLEFGAAFLELDAQYAFRQASDEDATEKHLSRYRLTLGYDPVRRFGGFVGGALEQAFDRDGSSLGGLAFAGIQLF